MNVEHQPEALYAQLQVLLQVLSKCNLPFFSEFRSVWDPLLKTNIKNPIVSTYRHSSNGQVFPQRIRTNFGLDLVLNFDITHLRAKYGKEQKTGTLNNFVSTSLSVLPNKHLTYNGSPCLYSYYPPNERRPSYENDGIFFAMSPILPKNFFIVDGSHRVSSFIDSGKITLPALLINPEVVPAYLISSSEMVTYLFLHDVNAINNAMKDNSLNSVKQKLSVFDKYSVLQFLIEENRIDTGNCKGV